MSSAATVFVNSYQCIITYPVLQHVAICRVHFMY